MVKRYVLIDTDDSNPSDIDFELGPVYDEASEITTDGYVSVATATAWLTAHVVSLSAWTAATEAQKAAALIEASDIIDSLPLQGHKYLTDGSQLRQFPRQYREGYDMDELTGVAEVPQAVLDACCREALAILQAGTGTDRQALQAQGVASYQIPGIISETFRPGVTNARYGLRSPDAYRLLSRYIARSVPIV